MGVQKTGVSTKVSRRKANLSSELTHRQVWSR